MHHSYLVPQIRGKIVLNRSIRNHLRLPSTCTLYAACIHDDATDPTGRERTDFSVVISQIPFSKWNDAYRIVLNTAAARGSFAKALSAIKKCGLNILLEDATAASIEGGLQATIIVEGRCSTGDSKATSPEDIEAEIRNLIDANALSSSRLFLENGDDAQPLKPIHCTQLKYLRRYAEIAMALRHPNADGTDYFDFDKEWRLQAKDSLLDLHNVENANLTRDHRNSGTSPIYSHLLEQLIAERLEAPNALISLDSDELYMRLWLAPPRPIYQFKINYSLTAREARPQDSCDTPVPEAPPTETSVTTEIAPSFHGASADFLDMLSEPPARMNIYHMENHLISKTVDRDASGASIAEERFQFCVVGDMSMCKRGLSVACIRDAIESTCQAWAETWNTRYQATGPRIDYNNSTLRQMSHAQIPVFLSTNMNRQTPSSQINFVKAVVTTLRDAGFCPVSVDVSRGIDLLDEVLSLLKACPLLVSVHLPDDDRKLDAHPGKCSPSPWVIFEESYALARSDEHTLIMRHDKVIKPNYSRSRVDCSTFDDTPESQEQATQRLRQRLSRYRRTDSWYTYIAALDRGSPHTVNELVAEHSDIEEWIQSLSRATTEPSIHVRGAQHRAIPDKQRQT